MYSVEAQRQSKCLTKNKLIDIAVQKASISNICLECMELTNIDLAQSSKCEK